MLLQPTQIEVKGQTSKSPPGVYDPDWLIQTRKNSTSSLSAWSCQYPQTERYLSLLDFIINTEMYNLVIWTIFAFRVHILLHHKNRKDMECKCSINVKSSPGCAANRNIKHYHLRAKWCACVHRPFFIWSFFFFMIVKQQIISARPPTFSCATMLQYSSFGFLCLKAKKKDLECWILSLESHDFILLSGFNSCHALSDYQNYCSN